LFDNGGERKYRKTTSLECRCACRKKTEINAQFEWW